jgi:hypothetical protein
MDMIKVEIEGYYNRPEFDLYMPNEIFDKLKSTEWGRRFSRTAKKTIWKNGCRLWKMKRRSNFWKVEMESKTVRSPAKSIQERFFEAINTLIVSGKLAGMKTFCILYILHQPKYFRLRFATMDPTKENAYKLSW